MRPNLIIKSMLTLSGCTYLNKMVRTDDVYKQSRTLSMQQEVQSVSDNKGSWIASSIRYAAVLKWFGESNAEGESELFLTMGVETSVRKDVLAPEIFLLVDCQKYNLSPVEKCLENFGEVESSTVVTTTRSTEKEKSDSRESATEQVTTSASNSTGTDSRRYVQYRCRVDRDLAEAISTGREMSLRFYLGDEGFTAKFRRAELSAVRKFTGEFLEL